MSYTPEQRNADAAYYNQLQIRRQQMLNQQTAWGPGDPAWGALSKLWNDLNNKEREAAMHLGFPSGAGGYWWSTSARWTNYWGGWWTLDKGERTMWETLGLTETLWAQWGTRPARPGRVRKVISRAENDAIGVCIPPRVPPWPIPPIPPTLSAIAGSEPEHASSTSTGRVSFGGTEVWAPEWGYEVPSAQSSTASTLECTRVALQSCYTRVALLLSSRPVSQAACENTSWRAHQ